MPRVSVSKLPNGDISRGIFKNSVFKPQRLLTAGCTGQADGQWQRIWKGRYENTMLEQKKIQKMSRREYCSYVQQHYSNDPQWVRTRLISKWDEDNNKKKNMQQINGQ